MYSFLLSPLFLQCPLQRATPWRSWSLQRRFFEGCPRWRGGRPSRRHCRDCRWGNWAHRCRHWGNWGHHRRPWGWGCWAWGTLLPPFYFFAYFFTSRWCVWYDDHDVAKPFDAPISLSGRLKTFGSFILWSKPHLFLCHLAFLALHFVLSLDACQNLRT